MSKVETIEQLEAIYHEPPSDAAIRKVATRLTPMYRKWIMTSRFCVLTTVGPAGTDGSPRGDIGPVVTELDPETLAMPDWHGNNRLDSLRNIITDGRVSLMFMVSGSTSVVRVNATAYLSVDPDLLSRFEVKGQNPRTVIIFKITEVYSQCSRALLRSGLWKRDDSEGLPTLGQILTEMTDGDFDGAKFDKEWPDRAVASLW